MAVRRLRVRDGLWWFAVLAAAQSASAQQFQERPGVLPVPTDYWTEAVTPVDADEDGRWDALFVHANGWAKPGDFHATGTFPLPPILLLNTGTSGGDPIFVDASATYLPAGLEIHGKGAAAADLDGDGHDDLVLAVAFFGTQRLLRKQPDTLAWKDESSRLPPMVINCFGAGVGDLDDDGDLDLVFADSGRPTFAAPGGKARLCINDGRGVFAEKPDLLNAAAKIGAQNVKIVDIDNDFDLDLIVDGKSPRTQIYFNDGSARFTLDDALIPAADVYTYETEWGDLDGDADIDGILMSYVFASEGAVQNFLVEEGALSFRATLESMVGLPVGEIEDDNEFVLLDADDDGDLDVINVSLQSQQEKLYWNRGTFGLGFLEFIPDAGFSKVTDSSLDMAAADFDGDGDHDAITGQGESNDFTDRYYRNTGPADTRPPRIGRLEDAPATLPLATLAGPGLVRHAWIQDSMWDDGVTYTKAELLFEVDARGGSSAGSSPMRHSGGQIFRGVLRPPPCPDGGLVGARVSYRVRASDPNGNTSVSGATTVVVCGSESFGVAGKLALVALAEPTLGSHLEVRVSGGPPARTGLLAIGLPRANAAQAPLALVPFGFDAAGTATLRLLLPDDPSAAGGAFDLRAMAPDASLRSGIARSNGLAVSLCAP